MGQLPKKKSPNPSSSLCSIILQTLYVRNHHPPNPKNPWNHLSTRSIMLSKNGSTSEPHQSKKWSTTCLRQKSIHPPSVLASSNRCASKNRLSEYCSCFITLFVRTHAMILQSYL